MNTPIRQTATYTVHRGAALDLLPSIADASYDCIVTLPPPPSYRPVDLPALVAHFVRIADKGIIVGCLNEDCSEWAAAFRRLGINASIYRCFGTDFVVAGCSVPGISTQAIAPFLADTLSHVLPNGGTVLDPIAGGAIAYRASLAARANYTAFESNDIATLCWCLEQVNEPEGKPRGICELLRQLAQIEPRQPRRRPALSPAEIEQIRSAALAGESVKSIAKRFGIQESGVRYRIKDIPRSPRAAQQPQQPQPRIHCTNPKLTEQQVLTIRARHRQGETIASMAREFKLKQDTVSHIVHRRSWRHLAEAIVTSVNPVETTRTESRVAA